jgi:hypothetical protein
MPSYGTGPYGVEPYGGTVEPLIVSSDLRFVGVDSDFPRLPQGVIDATKGTTVNDFAAGVHTHTAYVDVTGDTMTGALILAADPVATLQASTKGYVDKAKPSSNGESGPDSAGPTSAATPLTFDTDTVTDRGVAGRLNVWASVVYTKTVATDRFFILILVDGTAIATVHEMSPAASAAVAMSPTGSAAIAAGASHTIAVTITRSSGTGTATVAAGSQCTLHWIFVPT